MSTKVTQAKEIYDGAFLQAIQDDADDPHLDAALELAAVAWREAAIAFSGVETAAKCEPLNPYANALVTDERTE